MGVKEKQYNAKKEQREGKVTRGPEGAVNGEREQRGRNDKVINQEKERGGG